MNLGKLKNETFVNEYRKWGFKGRNQLIDAALDLFKKVKAKERRAAWRKAAHKEYSSLRSENIWEDIEGEDFENS